MRGAKLNIKCKYQLIPFKLPRGHKRNPTKRMTAAMLFLRRRSRSRWPESPIMIILIYSRLLPRSFSRYRNECWNK
jgi:hypothetical protein